MRLELIQEDDYGQAVAKHPDGTLFGSTGYPLVGSSEEQTHLDTSHPRTFLPIKAYSQKHFADGGSALEIDWS